MVIIETVDQLRALTGQETGVSGWTTLDQARIDAFAEVTGDHQWIHVDRERAARETPQKTTIAHGYLTLSLLPMLIDQIVENRAFPTSINYGANRIRFVKPVPSGARVRLRHKVLRVEGDDARARLTSEMTIEIDEGPDAAPARCMVAEVLTLYLR